MLKDYLLPLVLSAGLTAALGPAAIFAGRRLGVLDRPGGRRVNEKPVPRLGGLAIFGGFMLALALTPSPPGARAGAVFAGTAAFVLGFLDDLYDLKPGIKLAGQIFTASILPLCGISIRYLTNPWGGMFDLGWLAGPATVFWVVALMNMINLIDGLDGLAAGVCAIAAVNLLFLPQCVQRPFVALLCLLTIGCAAGFLPYNFHPARTFMGDGGSHFLGFVLGFITVAGALKGRAALTMSIPFLALAVPFFDTALAVFRRCQNGQSIFTGDRGHLHHRLLYLGFNHRQTVLLLYACSAVFGIGSNFLARLAAHLGVTLLTGLLICAAWGLHRVGVDRAAWHGRTHQSLPPQR
ncbi:MAG: glycosyltransferase family 4 protein [Patescibacteria group bacterium]